MSPLLLTTFVFVGFPSVPQLLVILVTLFLLATGIAGLSIVTAVSTTSFERFVTARGLVYYVLFFCSSIFYPLSLIQTLGQEGISHSLKLLKSLLLDITKAVNVNPLDCEISL